MTVTNQGSIIAAVTAIVSILATEHAQAQSLRDALTTPGVRNEVKKSESANPTGQPAKTLVMAAAEQTAAGSPPQSNAYAVKQDGYRYAPQVAAEAKAWPNAEIQIARARCNFLLRHIAAEVVALDPIKDGACGDPAPVKLVSVGSRPKVVFDPPALVNCDMVRSLHDWVTKDLQALARRHLKAPITTIETMSSYSCRNAYGRKDTRLSQHARANAIDIRGFRTSKDRKTQLLAHWGPTQRDANAAIRKEKKKAAALAKAQADAKTLAQAKAQVAAPSQKPGQATAVAERPETENSLLPRLSFKPSIGIDPKRLSLGAAPSRLGGPAVSALAEEEPGNAPAWPVFLVSGKIDTSRASTPRARFLRAAHRTACKIFGTVLGPEANRAHRNHFHMDRAQRDLGHYCR